MKKLLAFIGAVLCIPICVHAAAAAGAGAGKTAPANNKMHHSVLHNYLPVVALQHLIAQYLCAYHQIQTTEIPFNVSEIASTYNQKELITQNYSFKTGKRSLALWRLHNNKLIINRTLELSPIHIINLILSSQFISMLTTTGTPHTLSLRVCSRVTQTKQTNSLPTGPYILSLFEIGNSTFFVIASYHGIILYKETDSSFSQIQQIATKLGSCNAISHNGLVIAHLDTENTLSVWQLTQSKTRAYEYQLKLSSEKKKFRHYSAYGFITQWGISRISTKRKK
jgi:hypothetical protein